MAELIPSIGLGNFRKLNGEQLKRLKSCEITFDGEYLFTFVNGALEEAGYLRVQTEYLCQTANALRGESLEEILTKETVEV